jgi:E3 ubiquitin-protein ligase BRE1
MGEAGEGQCGLRNVEWRWALQSELALVKKELKAHRKSSAALDEAKASERAAGEAMEAHKAQLTVLQRQQAEGWELQAAMERKLEHLRLFVEALLEPPTALAGGAATVALAEAQAGRAAAEAEAAKARASVASDAAAAAAATTAAAVAEERLKAAGVALATANRHASEAAAAHRNECEGYISEIEAISGVCEETQTQNARLLMQLAERDEYANQMVAERLTAIQAQTTMQEERAGQAAQVASAATAVEEAEGRVMELQGQLQQVLQQLSKAAAEAHASNAAMETAKRSLAEQQRESGELKAAVERQRKVAAEARAATEEATADLERERGKRKRLEEDQNSLRSKVDRMHHAAASGTGSSELVEELQMYKELLKCQVCHDRNKEVVITKCFHLFCRPCIARNLEIRHRKCPGCGVAFGQADVHSVFL